MGKVAKAFGVGVKGALEVMLERDAFDAGEVVEGVVVLRISKSVQCRALVLTLEGIEKVSWQEGSSESTTYHDRKNEIVRDTLVLSSQEQFEPGEYDFHFTYRLREDLPASFGITGRRTTWQHSIDASIIYKLRASLPVTTGFSADLETVRPIEVFAQRLAHPVNSVEASASKIIKKLGLVSKGECTISAVMDQDAMVSGETLLVQTAINNSTRSDMSNITLALYEDLTFDVPGRGVQTGKTTVCTSKMSGMRAGEQLDQVLSLPLLTKSKGLPVTPTTTGLFVRWTYRLVIKCKFSMSSKLEVTLPVVVFPRDRPVDVVGVGTAVVATLEVGDEAEVSKAVVNKQIE